MASLMGITSVAFFGFVAISMVVYFVVPKRMQWGVLLVSSIAYYVLAAQPWTFCYLLASAGIAYAATNWGFANTKHGGKICVLAIVANLAIWLALKGSAFYTSLSAKVSALLPFVPVLEPLAIPAALGMGYYTFQVVGYILDCRWGTCEPERNFLKLLLFVSFYPLLTEGPITRRNDMVQLYEPHSFSYENLWHGAQRMLWGMFKKLVVADQLAIIVNGAWGWVTPEAGCWAWVAILIYPLQMYADFSGCMDIVIGAAEVYGIALPENFDSPFLSRTTQEFWQRWHISLGSWARDYVLYPVLKSQRMVTLGRRVKKKHGKRASKLLTLAIATAALWFVMGVWHGAPKYVVGVGLWYWAVQMLAEVLKPQLDWLRTHLVTTGETFSWRLFQRARTYVIYAVGATFFRGADVMEGFSVLKAGILALFGVGANPWIFFDDSIPALGIEHQDLVIAVIGVAFMVAVAVIGQRHGGVRIWMDRQGIVFRWGVWVLLFSLILIYGAYGPGYDASAFIYGDF